MKRGRTPPPTQEDDDDDCSSSEGATYGLRGSKLSPHERSAISLDESVSPGRLGAAMSGFDHAESVELPQGRRTRT